MKYNFKICTLALSLNPYQEQDIPVVEIDNSENYGMFFDSEINHLSLVYVEEIVEEIEAVLSGAVDFYEGFGFEVYMIECDREKAVVKNVYEDDRIEAVLPIEEIYELMRDWRDFQREHYRIQVGEESSPT